MSHYVGPIRAKNLLNKCQARRFPSGVATLGEDRSGVESHQLSGNGFKTNNGVGEESHKLSTVTRSTKRETELM